MRVIINRFDEEYAVVEMLNHSLVKIPRILLPDSKEGDVIIIEIENNEKENADNMVNRMLNDANRLRSSEKDQD